MESGAPPPPFPPSPPPRRRWLLWTLGGIGAAFLASSLVIAALIAAGLYRFAREAAPILEKARSRQLASSYVGELKWDGKTLPITWRDNGTRDNDGDHAVTLIAGENDVRLRVIWGWMDSGLGRVGANATVDQVRLPPRWPRPRSLVLKQALPDGGWAGVLSTETGEEITLTLATPRNPASSGQTP